MNCVVIFLDVRLKKNKFPRIRSEEELSGAPVRSSRKGARECVSPLQSAIGHAVSSRCHHGVITAIRVSRIIIRQRSKSASLPQPAIGHPVASRWRHGGIKASSLPQSASGHQYPCHLRIITAASPVHQVSFTYRGIIRPAAIQRVRHCLDLSK